MGTRCCKNSVRHFEVVSHTKRGQLYTRDTEYATCVLFLGVNNFRLYFIELRMYSKQSIYLYLCSVRNTTLNPIQRIPGSV